MGRGQVRGTAALGPPNPSHIVPMVVGDPARCRAISDALLDGRGVHAQPINHPTVPRGTERLRLTPSPLHTGGDVDRLVDSLSAIRSRLSLRKAA